MPATTVLESLENVEFYTALDPYYWSIDNRPLTNLSNNIVRVATALDSSSGDGKRAALAAASIAQAVTGSNAAVGEYDVTQSGLRIDILHSFGTFMVAGVDAINTYQEPQLAIHDGITSITNIPAASSAGYSALYAVKMTKREPTLLDKIPTEDSATKVAEINAIKINDIQNNAAWTPLAEQPNEIVIMYLVIPAGTTELDETHVHLANFRTIGQASALEQYSEVSYVDVQKAGLNTDTIVDLTGDTTIDLNRANSIEVFVDGVVQFDWTANPGNSSIELASPLTANATIRVRQANIALI